MRAAIYAYAAPTEQDCQVQLQQLREFCARRGWQVVEEYADVCSRKTKAGRAELNRLLRDAGRKQFECVLVCRLERFGPSLLQTVVQIAKLAKVGVRFLAAEQVLDTEGWTCGQWDILRAAAEFERQGFSQKVKAGMAAAKQQGKRIGRPRLSFDQQKAQTMRAAGASIRKIGAALAVSPTTIRRITPSEDGTLVVS
jgi:DNA invertase Pin-like site-specific DNA recombinase